MKKAGSIPSTSSCNLANSLQNRPIDTELHDDVQRLNTVAQQRPLSNHTSGDYSAHADVYDGPDPEADASFTTPERSKRVQEVI